MTYFTADLSVFAHDETDRASLLMINAQFHVNGHATQSQITNAFGLASITPKRAVKRFRTLGVAGFYATPRRRGPVVLTAPVLAEARRLLGDGVEPAAAANRLEIKPDTLNKAIRAGRLVRPAVIAAPAALPAAGQPTSKSARSTQDQAAPMGMGACHTLARVAASQGELNAVAPSFAAALDVPYGGVLCALPALLALGLIDTSERRFTLPDGYYGMGSLFLLLALMSPARLGPVESLRYCAPGEWGKLLGLDRVPEVRTLRAKLRLLSAGTGPAEGRARRSADAGWRRPRNSPRPCMWMAMYGSTTAIRPRCPATTSPANGSACAPPPTTGSTPGTVSPSASCRRRWIPA